MEMYHLEARYEDELPLLVQCVSYSALSGPGHLRGRRWLRWQRVLLRAPRLRLSPGFPYGAASADNGRPEREQAIDPAIHCVLPMSCRRTPEFGKFVREPLFWAALTTASAA